jgi:hypothetical protein
MVAAVAAVADVAAVAAVGAVATAVGADVRVDVANNGLQKASKVTPSTRMYAATVSRLR